MNAAKLLGAALAALALSATACADQGAVEPAVSGMIAIVLEVSDDSTGALLMTVTGGPVDSAVAGTGEAFYERDAAGNGAKLFVTGILAANSAVARIAVPDVRAAADYRIVVNEAANRVSFAQRAQATVAARLTTPLP